MTTLTRENKLTAPTRNSHVAWTATNPVVPEGVLIIVKDRLYVGSVEYAIGDGVSNYNALRKFGEAKDADGKIDLANVVTNSADGLLKLDANGKAPAERLYITGALAEGNIIESGENANGRYVKWADGTMLCWTVINLGTITVVQNDGSPINWVFPVEFISTVGVVVHAQPMGWAANRFVFCATPLATTYCVGGCYASTGSWPLTGSTFAGLYAIGRWK